MGQQIPQLHPFAAMPPGMRPPALFHQMFLPQATGMPFFPPTGIPPFSPPGTVFPPGFFPNCFANLQIPNFPGRMGLPESSSSSSKDSSESQSPPEGSAENSEKNF